MKLAGAEANLAAASMRKVLLNNETWEVLYWRSSPYALWIMSFPDSGHHGGGVPSLELIDDVAALSGKLRHPAWVAEDPNTVVDLLVDRWCERRALSPLRYILDAWPNYGLTDGYGALRDALAKVRSVSRDELEATESELAHLAQNGIERLLDRA
jgi:hypothetical protein